MVAAVKKGTEEFHDRLKAEGYVIYAGQGNLARSIFRVSTMGAITYADMTRFLSAVRNAIDRLVT